MAPKRHNRTRKSLAVLEAIARLRDCGVQGNDDDLEILLKAACFNVEQAANLWLDQNASAGVSDSMACNAEGNTEGSASGYLKAELQVEKQRQRVDTRRQNSMRTSLIGSEGQEHPTGVHYQASNGESYDVDVLQMVQTNTESRNTRRVQRQNTRSVHSPGSNGVWRFEKSPRSWAFYPQEVSKELEHVFQGLHSDRLWDRQEVSAESPSKAGDALLELRSENKLLSSMEQSLESGHLTVEELGTTRELLFSSAEAGSLRDVQRAANLLLAFSVRHGMKCDASFARRAGLVVGSMCLLRAVFKTTPQLCLMGEDVFDKKYPKLSMQDVGRKNCVRCLLAHGMRLGGRTCVPPGKLLRKVEADAEPAWAWRWLNSMMSAYPQMPEVAQDRICMFLGLPMSS